MTARFFFDCEFIEDGTTIELISIGIVPEHSEREYYAIRSDAPWRRIRRHPWLMGNVVPQLPGGLGKPGRGGFGELKWRLDRTDPRVKPKQVIANEVAAFLLEAGEPVELWASYGAYDHVVLAQLWGTMADYPVGLPMWTNDVQQEIQRLDARRDSLPEQPAGEHDALADARHVRTLWQAMQLIQHSGSATEKRLATGGQYFTVGETGPELRLPPGAPITRHFNGPI